MSVVTFIPQDTVVVGGAGGGGGGGGFDGWGMQAAQIAASPNTATPTSVCRRGERITRTLHPPVVQPKARLSLQRATVSAVFAARDQDRREGAPLPSQATQSEYETEHGRHERQCDVVEPEAPGEAVDAQEVGEQLRDRDQQRNRREEIHERDRRPQVAQVVNGVRVAEMADERLGCETNEDATPVKSFPRLP
jgi:hypothetical protein